MHVILLQLVIKYWGGALIEGTHIGNSCNLQLILVVKIDLAHKNMVGITMVVLL